MPTAAGQDVLWDINLQVAPGSFYALLGRNGAGKSTLLKILAGALVPHEGASRTLGVESKRLGVEEWRAIGFLSEAQPLYKSLTGAGKLPRFTSQLYPNWDAAFCDHLRRSLDLPLDRKVGRYSKGERMTFILLLAMSFHPRLLLLDEPFSGLDVVAKEQLISCLLEATGQDQWSVICASHDIGEVERLADSVGIIDHGALTLSEPLESLQARYRRVQVFSALSPAAAELDSTMLQARQSGTGLSFVEAAFSERRDQELRRRFGPGIEFTAMPLREILLSVFTRPEAGHEYARIVRRIFLKDVRAYRYPRSLCLAVPDCRRGDSAGRARKRPSRARSFGPVSDPGNLCIDHPGHPGRSRRTRVSLPSLILARSGLGRWSGQGPLSPSLPGRALLALQGNPCRTLARSARAARPPLRPADRNRRLVLHRPRRAGALLCLFPERPPVAITSVIVPLAAVFLAGWLRNSSYHTGVLPHFPGFDDERLRQFRILLAEAVFVVVSLFAIGMRYRTRGFKVPLVVAAAVPPFVSSRFCGREI